jgi:hypothetical protein
MFDLLDDDSAASPLSAGERLLLLGLRHWAAARSAGDCPQGAAGLIAWRIDERAAAFFAAWMHMVEQTCRRPLRVHVCPCARPLPDERRLIDCVGLSILGLELGETLLAPLSAAPASVMALARPLGVAFSAAGWPVPARFDGAEGVRAEPTLLH